VFNIDVNNDVSVSKAKHLAFITKVKAKDMSFIVKAKAKVLWCPNIKAKDTVFSRT